jgi:hypothetical protein
MEGLDADLAYLVIAKHLASLRGVAIDERDYDIAREFKVIVQKYRCLHLKVPDWTLSDYRLFEGVLIVSKF